MKKLQKLLNSWKRTILFYAVNKKKIFKKIFKKIKVIFWVISFLSVLIHTDAHRYIYILTQHCVKSHVLKMIVLTLKEISLENIRAQKNQPTKTC